MNDKAESHKADRQTTFIAIMCPGGRQLTWFRRGDQLPVVTKRQPLPDGVQQFIYQPTGRYVRRADRERAEVYVYRGVFQNL